MRRLLVVAAVLVLLAGASLFLLPSRTGEFFAWTIASPMTAVFLGAAYWSAVVLELGGARARSWAGGRVAVPTVFVFTTLTLVATLAHLPAFHLGDEHALLGRVIAWTWLAVYVAVPVAMVVISIVQQRSSEPDPPRAQRLPRPLRCALAALLVVLAVAGTGLFAAPAATASWWPWVLTALTAQAAGAWLVGLSVAAGHALVEDDLARVKPLGTTAVAFAVLQVVALARHGGELAWSTASAWAYLAALGALLAVGGWIVVARPGPATVRPAAHRRPPSRRRTSGRMLHVQDARIAMWSGPRTLSTATMRAWGNRADTAVVDEPLYAYYLAATGLDHPGRDAVLASQPTDWRVVVRRLTEEPLRGGATIGYQKHMTHHVLPEVDLDAFDGLRHAFLVRDPRRLLASYAKVREQPTLADLGLEQQVALFRRFGGPVVDSDDLLRDPEGRLRALCAALDVPFDPAMLSWPAGPRDTDGVWAPYWYGGVEASTGFGPYREEPADLPASLEPLAEQCRPFYDELAARRI